MKLLHLATLAGILTRGTETDKDGSGELYGATSSTQGTKRNIGHGHTLQSLQASLRLPQMLTMAQPRTPSQEPHTDPAKLLQPCSSLAHIPIICHVAPLKPVWRQGERGLRSYLESVFLQMLVCIGWGNGPGKRGGEYKNKEINYLFAQRRSAGLRGAT